MFVNKETTYLLTWLAVARQLHRSRATVESYVITA